MEQRPLLVVLKIVDSFLSPLSPGSSRISGRDPLLVVLYCNSPVFTKIKKNVFGVNCLIVCIVCSVCFAEIIIGEYFSPYFSYRMRDRTFSTPTHDLCDIGFH